MNQFVKKLSLPLSIALLAGCAGNLKTDIGNVPESSSVLSCDDGGKDIQVYRIIANRMYEKRNPIITTIPKAEQYLLADETMIAGKPIIEYGRDLIDVMERVPDKWDAELVERMRCAGIFEENRKVIPADLRLIRDVFADNLDYIKQRYEVIEKIEQRNAVWGHIKSKNRDSLSRNLDSISVIIDEIFVVDNLDAVVFDVAVVGVEYINNKKEYGFSSGELIDAEGKRLSLVSIIESPVGNSLGGAITRFSFKGRAVSGEYTLKLNASGYPGTLVFDIPDNIIDNQSMALIFN